jgi:transcriptional regulator with XRE-family HTH domain
MYNKQQDMSEMAKRIKIAREHLNLTQDNIAKNSHITKRAYVNYEGGVRSVPSEVLSVYSEYGIDVNWLLTGKGEMFLPKKEEETPSAHIDDEMTTEVISLMGGLDEQGKQAVLLAARQAERITRLEKKFAE